MTAIRPWRYLSCLFLSLLLALPALAQNDFQDEPVFTDMKEAMKTPLAVKRLDLSKQKLSKVPADVFLLKNLYELVLSKNKLTRIPDEISQLKKLRILRVDRNKIESLPESIGSLQYLEILDINRSDMFYLPESLGNCSSLERIIAWDTNLSTLPASLKKCTQLMYIDLRNIMFSKAQQEELEKMLPGTKIDFTIDCNCGPNP